MLRAIAGVMATSIAVDTFRGLCSNCDDIGFAFLYAFAHAVTVVLATVPLGIILVSYAALRSPWFRGVFESNVSARMSELSARPEPNAAVLQQLLSFSMMQSSTTASSFSTTALLPATWASLHAPMQRIWKAKNAATAEEPHEKCVLCLGDCEAVVLALAVESTVASKKDVVVRCTASVTPRAFFRCERCRAALHADCASAMLCNAVMSCTPRLLACPVCNKRM